MELVVRAVYSCASGEKQEQFTVSMWVVCRLGHVDLDIVKFGDFLR